MANRLNPWQEPPHKPDPREGPPERKWVALFVTATLAAYMIINIYRGLKTGFWNW